MFTETNTHIVNKYQTKKCLPNSANYIKYIPNMVRKISFADLIY